MTDKERGKMIHFRNEPFRAVVEGQGDELIKCTPVVFDDPFNCGVGIFYEDGKGQVWGMVTPRNLIAAWRATEVLRHLKRIGHGTLCSVYYTGQRNPHQSELERNVQPMIAEIGQEAYDRIMAMSVPEEIIRAILDNQGMDFPPDTYPITDEVRAGTIQWRQEFADAGIKHPEEIDLEKLRQEQTIAKFERLLASYAKNRHLARDSFGMGYVEGGLLTLLKKGADKEHPDYVLVALAGVVSELAVTEFTAMIVPGGYRGDDFGKHLEETRDKAILESARWLAYGHGQSWVQRAMFWRRYKDSFTVDGAKDLLTRLFGEYFPPKKREAEVPA